MAAAFYICHRSVKLSACFAIAVLLTAPGCSDDGIGPAFSDPTKLVWRIDSAAADLGWGLDFNALWGTSHNNLFLVGRSANQAQKVHRFDGSTITEVRIPRAAYPNDVLDFNAIQGTAATQIWAVGTRGRFNFNPPPHYFDSSCVLYFNGSSWAIQLEGLGRELLTVLPVSSDEVFAGGLKGTILRCVGAKWTRENCPESVSITALARSGDGKFYASGYLESDTIPSHPRLLSRTPNGWIIVDSTRGFPLEQQTFGRFGLTIVNGVTFTCSPGIYANAGSAWATQFYSEGIYISRIIRIGHYGLLACGSKSTLLYYDGAVWTKIHLPTPPSLTLTDVWTDGYAIAITADPDDGGNAYLLTGTPN